MQVPKENKSLANRKQALQAEDDEEEQIKRSSLKLVRVKELRRKVQELMNKAEDEKRERRPSVVELEGKKRSELIKEWESVKEELEKEKHATLQARRPSVLAIAKEKKSSDIINKLESIIEHTYKSSWTSAGPTGSSSTQLKQKRRPEGKDMLGKRGAYSTNDHPEASASDAAPTAPVSKNSTDDGSTKEAWVKVRASDGGEKEPRRASALLFRGGVEADPVTSSNVSAETEIQAVEMAPSDEQDEPVEESREHASETPVHSEEVAQIESVDSSVVANDTPPAAVSHPPIETKEIQESDAAQDVSVTDTTAHLAPYQQTEEVEQEQVTEPEHQQQQQPEQVQNEEQEQEKVTEQEQLKEEKDREQEEKSTWNTGSSWAGCAKRNKEAIALQIGGRSLASASSQPSSSSQLPATEQTPPIVDIQLKQAPSVVSPGIEEHSSSPMPESEVSSDDRCSTELPADTRRSGDQGATVRPEPAEPTESGTPVPTSDHSSEASSVKETPDLCTAPEVQTDDMALATGEKEPSVAPAPEHAGCSPSRPSEVSAGRTAAAVMLQSNDSSVPSSSEMEASNMDEGYEQVVQRMPAITISYQEQPEDLPEYCAKPRSRSVVATSVLFDAFPSFHTSAEGNPSHDEEPSPSSDEQDPVPTPIEQTVQGASVVSEESVADQSSPSEVTGEASDPAAVLSPALEPSAAAPAANPEAESEVQQPSATADPTVTATSDLVPTQHSSPAPPTPVPSQTPSALPLRGTLSVPAAGQAPIPLSVPEPIPMPEGTSSIKTNEEKALSSSEIEQRAQSSKKTLRSDHPIPTINVDEEYSSDEEKEQEGVKVKVKCRSKSVNRADMDPPTTKEGWLTKGKEARFPHWKKRWFVLEYPFLKYYTSANERQLKGHISLRGGCMIDTFTHTVKNVKHPDCTFRINGGAKMFLLEAASPQEKKEWVAAMWSNIFYANPSKRHGGVGYPVELQLGLGQESRKCILIVEMPGLRLLDAGTKSELWKRPIHHVKAITRPDDEAERWIIFNFDRYGGSVMLQLPSTTPTVVFNSVQSVILTHVAWRGNPLLKGNY